jgi:hypothetical protein
MNTIVAIIYFLGAIAAGAVVLMLGLPAIAVSAVALALAAIGLAVWTTLPRRDDRDADIERQIASLRRHADHAVTTRPRVRANGCHAAPGHLKAAPKADKPKACGGGMCHHRADCSDTYCPGRISASLAGTQEHRHAHR